VVKEGKNILLRLEVGSFSHSEHQKEFGLQNPEGEYIHGHDLSLNLSIKL